MNEYLVLRWFNSLTTYSFLNSSKSFSKLISDQEKIQLYLLVRQAGVFLRIWFSFLHTAFQEIGQQKNFYLESRYSMPSNVGSTLAIAMAKRYVHTAMKIWSTIWVALGKVDETGFSSYLDLKYLLKLGTFVTNINICNTFYFF